jgi:hypothetical protein
MNHLSTDQIDQGLWRLPAELGMCWLHNDEREPCVTVIQYYQGRDTCVRLLFDWTFDVTHVFCTVFVPTTIRHEGVQFTHSEVIGIIEYALKSHPHEHDTLVSLQQHYVDKLEEWLQPRDEAMLDQVGPILEPQFGRDVAGIVAGWLASRKQGQEVPDANTLKKYPPPGSGGGSTGMRLAL